MESLKGVMGLILMDVPLIFGLITRVCFVAVISAILSNSDGVVGTQECHVVFSSYYEFVDAGCRVCFGLPSYLVQKSCPGDPSQDSATRSMQSWMRLTVSQGLAKHPKFRTNRRRGSERRRMDRASNKLLNWLHVVSGQFEEEILREAAL